jgi:hypothetical protein
MWSLRNLYLVLLHHPVYDRRGEVVTTAVTNMDIHDLSRLARTYGLAGFIMVTPIDRQRELLRRIIEHWVTGEGARYNPLRAEAIGMVDIHSSLEEVVVGIADKQGMAPLLVGTGARLAPENTLSAATLHKELEKRDKPVLLLLGTGWGVAREVLDAADYRLEAIEGLDDYNHLSVRTAAAILLDRLACAGEPNRWRSS